MAQKQSEIFEECMIYYLGHKPKKQTASWYYCNGFSVAGAVDREKDGIR